MKHVKRLDWEKKLGDVVHWFDQLRAVDDIVSKATPALTDSKEESPQSSSFTLASGVRGDENRLRPDIAGVLPLLAQDDTTASPLQDDLYDDREKERDRIKESMISSIPEMEGGLVKVPSMNTMNDNSSIDPN